jgi:hypothetical protein
VLYAQPLTEKFHRGRRNNKKKQFQKITEVGLVDMAAHALVKCFFLRAIARSAALRSIEPVTRALRPGEESA